MAIIGWFALILVAVIVLAFAAGGAAVSRGFTGKVSLWYGVPACGSLWLFYLAWVYCPFTVIV